MSSIHRNWVSSLRATTARELERRDDEETSRETYDNDSSHRRYGNTPLGFIGGIVGVNMSGPLVNKVQRVHWYIKDNAKLHHTIKFDQIHDKASPKPVLRRGQTIYLAIRFADRDFDLDTDRVVLNFKFGSRPSVYKGTLGVVPVLNKTFTRTKDDWDCRIDPGTKGRDLVLQVFIPAQVPVGIWHLGIRSGLKDRSQGRSMAVHNEETDVYILFNPWCKDDLVYMENEAEREEYVMNDKGKVYVGSHRRPRGRPWAFGQFDDVTLPVACYILELGYFSSKERGNPVTVVRGISAGVNDFDDEGILVGRWDNEYSDGVAPYKWTGSVRILEEYIKNGYQPVKYGQCWVFSALTTTICRALGIPCRSVTNFVSAHDTNSSLTIDKFFSKSGDEIEGGPNNDNHDSIWNFHVWNDVWMARTDLPPGYGGWQAIDATPQEESDHKMQCGPASLEAIRRGDIGLGFDCPFVFAEVNADIMHWGEDEESDWGWSRMKINKFHVGRSLLTQKVGVEDDNDRRDREDVMENYKSAEGSAAERLAIHNAIRGSKRAQLYYEYKKNTKEDVFFDMEEIESIFIGDLFRIKVLVRNDSEEKRTISAALTARSILYTGVNHSIIKKAEGKFTLEAGQEQDVALTIEYNEYWKRLQEQCLIKMYVICRVEETGQNWTEEDDFQVEKPSLQITAPESVKKGEMCEAVFSFKNPLDEELTECSLSVDGSGLMRPQSIDVKGSVPAGGDFSHTFTFRPRIQGSRKVVVSFNSKQLYDINGVKTINVLKAVE